jgi:protein TonB
MTQRPELVNLAEVSQALVENYPPVLRDGGIGGRVVVWFLIDETGAVRRTQVSRTSGRGELDEAALRVARQMRFTPAENRGTRVPVWVEIPILFQAK